MSAKARPSSAQSRTAWGDYGHARPDSQFDFGQEGIRDDPDLNAGAMEEDFASADSPKGKGKTAAVTTTSGKQKKSKSCLGKIGSGIRSLWATRQTEDVKGDRELHVKTTLRELIIYVVFLVILCIVTFGMTGTNMYYYTKVMSDLFLDTTYTGGGSFRTITSVEDFWKFAKGPLVKGLYWETWYNNQAVPDEQLGYIYYENKILGVPRLRQLQVHSNSCVVHDDFKNVIRECFESYSESLENKDSFGQKDNMTAWYYRSQDELDGSSHTGHIATYSGSGYIQNLKQNKSESETIIEYLFDNRWIRRGTRVIFIDFTVYNANINLFCVVKLSVEFPATGGAISQATLRTVKLIRYVTVMDYFIMACEFILCLFILYYIVEEAIEIKKHKLSYFKSVWNILDILVILIAVLCIAFNIYRTVKVNSLLEELLDKPNEYADFEFLGFGQTQFDNAIAIAVFFAWIKIFKYISFNKTMTQLSSTLGKCAKDLAGFAVMFFIIFLAFTQLGYLLFGTQVKDFSNFKNSFFTLFRIILGDFDFDQLEAANRVLGPIFFMMFVFFVFFVLINMFLAIINDTYSEVKGDMANQKNEFEMTDYFKRGYMKMMSKLKHDKIVDIQKALQTADINNDKQVDFDEWRQDLKTRGYADGEIEALFAKYDLDGDRVLDEEEQRRMQADLTVQKNALNKEYDDLDKMQRPDSTRRSNSRTSFNDGSGDDSDDDDSRTKSSRSGPSQGVQYEEFTVLSRRVDRMEHSIGSIVSKIDAVLVKLEAMEKAKLKRRETMGKILDSITERKNAERDLLRHEGSDGTSDEVKREQMERLVREELERWDSESSITPQASGRGASPSSSGRGGARSRGGNAPLPDIMSDQELCEEDIMKPPSHTTSQSTSDHAFNSEPSTVTSKLPESVFSVQEAERPETPKGSVIPKRSESLPPKLGPHVTSMNPVSMPGSANRVPSATARRVVPKKSSTPKSGARKPSNAAETDSVSEFKVIDAPCFSTMQSAGLTMTATAHSHNAPCYDTIGQSEIIDPPPSPMMSTYTTDSLMSPLMSDRCSPILACTVSQNDDQSISYDCKLPSSQDVDDAKTDSINANKVPMMEHKSIKDIRPITPILPGIPSNSYSRQGDETKNNPLSLPRSPSDAISFEDGSVQSNTCTMLLTDPINNEAQGELASSNDIKDKSIELSEKLPINEGSFTNRKLVNERSPESAKPDAFSSKVKPKPVTTPLGQKVSVGTLSKKHGSVLPGNGKSLPHQPAQNTKESYKSKENLVTKLPSVHNLQNPKHDHSKNIDRKGDHLERDVASRSGTSPDQTTSVPNVSNPTGSSAKNQSMKPHDQTQSFPFVSPPILVKQEIQPRPIGIHDSPNGITSGHDRRQRALAQGHYAEEKNTHSHMQNDRTHGPNNVGQNSNDSHGENSHGSCSKSLVLDLPSDQQNDTCV